MLKQELVSAKNELTLHQQHRVQSSTAKVQTARRLADLEITALEKQLEELRQQVRYDAHACRCSFQMLEALSSCSAVGG